MICICGVLQAGCGVNRKQTRTGLLAAVIQSADSVWLQKKLGKKES